MEILPILTKFTYKFWNIVQESSPWLLVGFVLAGLIHQYLPIAILKKHLAEKKALSIFKATIMGIPLPLCSCSIIPISRSVRLSGASKGATAAFMISTPEIGVDSFLLTKGLLGLPLAIIRVIAAFISAYISGILVDKLSSTQQVEKEENIRPCCRNKNLFSSENSKEEKSNWLKFTLFELPADLSKPLLLGFVVSAIISLFLPNDFISSSVENPYLQMLCALIISIPVYVCASSSTPIAASLITKGLAPGAALVFLLAGPATNTSTIFAAQKMFGTRGVIGYLTGIILTSLAIGSILQFIGNDFLIGALGSQLGHHNHLTLFNQITGIILFVLLIYPLLTGLFKARQ